MGETLSRRAVTTAVVLTLVAGVATGCGGHAESGRAIFVHDCASCHTIAGRESGASGGDLAGLRFDVADIASFVKVMPTRSHLSNADVLAVARYVHSRR